MTMANDEKIGVTEQSYSSSSEVKKRTTKRPSSSSSKRKIKSGDKTANNTKAESWSSTSTASENYNHSTLFVPPTTLQSEEHEAPVPPPVAVIKKSGIRKSGAEVRGLIAPTTRQRQLMREVSGLGLEDPVFGKGIYNDEMMKTDHPSFIFDDMHIHDVPEDMRDIISLASDRTDIVETEEGSKSSTKIASSYSLSSPAGLRSSNSSFMPLLGLEPGTGMAPSPSNTEKMIRGKIPRHLTLNDSTHHSLSQSFTSDLNYVPSAVSSWTQNRTNKERRNSTASSVALDDKALAAQVNFMLSMNDSSTSFGSSRSSHNRSTATNRPVSKRQDNRLSTSSNKFSSPALPLSVEAPIQEDRRFLPESMDAIFSSNKISTRIKKSSTPVEIQNNNTKKRPKSKKSVVKTKASEDNNNS